MRRNTIRTSVMLGAILLLPLLVLLAQQTSAFLIEGPQGQTKVIQVQGKSYVEVDEVARITGGIAALCRESDHSECARERYAGPSSAAASGHPF